jgi:hypothetical protein
MTVTGVPRANIPPSPFAKTEAPSSGASLMTLGGEVCGGLFQSIPEQLEENGGLNDDQRKELATYLQTNNSEIVAKRDRVGEFLERLDAEAKAIREAEKRLAARRAGYEKVAECVRSSIFQMMQDAGIVRVEGKLFSFAIRKNPPRVEINDESLIPAEFVSYEPRIDKRAIKDRIEEGKTIPGAELVQSTRLEIR